MDDSNKRLIVSPNGRFAVEFGDDFGEIRMGSPEFGRIRIVHSETGFGDQLDPVSERRSVGIEFGEKLFGGNVAFSDDSRFVALEQLVEEHRFRAQLMVVDIRRRKIFFADVPPIGTVTPLRWNGSGLIYSAWEFAGPKKEKIWTLP